MKRFGYRALGISLVLLGGLLIGIDQHWRHLPLNTAEHQIPEPTDPLPAPSEKLTAEQIVQLALARWKLINDYRCTINSTNKRSGNLEENVLDVIYKRPGLFRHAIIDGTSRGVILTYNGQAVHARPGGLMSIMTVEVDPRDARLVDGRGKPFFQTDWGSELLYLNEAARTGWLRRESDQTINDSPTWVISVQPASGNDEIHRVWIDQKSRLLARAVSARRGQTLRDARYSNIALNTSPSDTEFSLIK
jgi:outer membrane lipoprotein-sorting protein